MPAPANVRRSLCPPSSVRQPHPWNRRHRNGSVPPMTPTPPSPSFTALSRHLRETLNGSGRVSLADLLHRTTVACVDGRKADRVIGAPGGNAGLFVLLLTALERFRGDRLSSDRVRVLFEEYLDHFGAFYLHSDGAALRTLRENLRARHPSLDGSDVEAIVQDPPEAIREALLQELRRPEHVGCGHLRLMATYPDEYGVRPGLLEAFWTAYFSALWRGEPRVAFDVLPGDHEERAVVTVEDEATDGDVSSVVVLPPHHDDVQVFVYHPQAVTFLYRKHAEFLVGTGDASERDVEGLVSTQATLGNQQLTATLRHLAPDLPHLKARVGRDAVAIDLVN